jgi:lipopolysaccharide heptosyltransferase II
MKILVHSLVNLGDVLLSTSAISLLKRIYPDADVTMMIRPDVKDVIENNPIIDHVLIFDYKNKKNSLKNMWDFVSEIKKKKFDMSISFDRKLRPAILTWMAGIPVRIGPNIVFDDAPSKVTLFYTDIVYIKHDLKNTLQAETYQAIIRGFTGKKGKEEPVMANVSSENEKKAKELIRKLPVEKKKIALCVKGTFPLKTWPKEYFKKVVEMLNKEYEAAFFIVGAPNDKEYADEVIKEINVPVANFCNETTLVDLAALLRKTDLFITVDTGAAHIAATTRVPMVVIYGCTSPKRWHPINENTRVLTSNEECCPCHKQPNECIRPKCLWNITPEAVLEKCIELFGKK